MHIAFVIPKVASKLCITGESAELMTPLLAFTIPDAIAALLFGTNFEIAPIIMPKHTAPVPAERQMPKVNTSAIPERITDELKNPAASNQSPIFKMNALDFFIARIPKIGCEMP